MSLSLNATCKEFQTHGPVSETRSWRASRVHSVLRLHADDTRVYFTVPVDSESSETSLLSHCIENVAAWFSVNRLRLNPVKTQLIRLESERQIEKVDDHICVPSYTSKNIIIIIIIIIINFIRS